VVVVDVTGVVTVAVDDQFCSALSSSVEAIIVSCVGDVEEYSFERRHVLCHGPLHKATEVTDDEDQVWPRVNEVAEAADELAVQSRLLLLCFTVSAQFELLVHLCLC
jgi:hypothetical protein